MYQEDTEQLNLLCIMLFQMFVLTNLIITNSYF